MSVREDILKGPESIAHLQEKGRSLTQLADGLFTNFMYYAKKNWQYQASSKKGGEDLLNGYTGPVPCGGIANALRVMLEELGVPKGALGVEYVTISGYVWTKPKYCCFDRAVVGNVRRVESPGIYSEGCMFSEHYFLKCYLKYYDPCLNAVYAEENDAVRLKTPITEVFTKGVLHPGDTPDTFLMFNPDEVVPGWVRGTWSIVRHDDIFKYVNDKYTLMAISTKLKHGKVAEKARKLSREMFNKEGRLQTWKEAHLKAGIDVK
jgi:hypothetical protein